ATSGEWSIEVTPGDVEVERGTRLVVTARFDGRVPAEARLESVLGESVRRVSMKQNLADPIFVATIPEVDADGTYRISFAKRESREF
ncbi:MAG: hypothetical protein GWN87_17935, partial [Desulfuromonadales bacterium]|nr:hypothetical protein [Desulfuromonadales bacterium]